MCAILVCYHSTECDSVPYMIPGESCGVCVCVCVCMVNNEMRPGGIFLRFSAVNRGVRQWCGAAWYGGVLCHWCVWCGLGYVCAGKELVEAENAAMNARAAEEEAMVSCLVDTC
jgi:hypothetical protein